ncbi:HAMP domain-containing histidine kinase, partial [candidate division WOR-3 bacterium]|nr:HAMP domain-containing histidine kinase [candidate division WOR-3 bacterium]
TQANEELKRLSEAKSEFVAAASHDLRTPLTTIMEAIRLAEDGALGPLTGDLKEFLRYAREDGLRLRDLINNLLDEAKIERGKMEAKPGRVDVRASLEQARVRFELLAQEKSLRLAVEPPEPETAVRCDPGHYQRILLNLVSNAVKFTPAGGTVSLRAEPEAGGMVRLTVADTGMGIPRREQHRVFQKFEQIRRPGVEVVVGTGLGLALCRQLVELNGGRIGFESEEDRGSTFHFSLPAWPAEAGPADPTQ